MNSCGHAACDCRVDPEEPYCSEHCRQRWESRRDDDERCHCGHAECLGERGVRPDDEELAKPPEPE